MKHALGSPFTHPHMVFLQVVYALKLDRLWRFWKLPLFLPRLKSSSSKLSSQAAFESREPIYLLIDHGLSLGEYLFGGTLNGILIGLALVLAPSGN